MKVVWSRSALSELREIHLYYKKHVSAQMADNIRESVFTAAQQLAAESMSGMVMEELASSGFEFRSVIRGHYRIIYLITEKQVYITDVFDTRLDPKKLDRNKERGL